MLGGMAQRTIYLPDDLDRRLQAAGINVSRICRDVLEQAVRFVETTGAPGPGVVVSGNSTPPSPERRAAAVEQRLQAAGQALNEAVGRRVEQTTDRCSDPTDPTHRQHHFTGGSGLRMCGICKRPVKQ